MRRMVRGVLASGAGALLLLASSQARAWPSCENICGDYTSCDEPCTRTSYCNPDEENCDITCGEYGRCNARQCSPPREVGRRVIGRGQDSYFFACRYEEIYEVFFEDPSGCVEPYTTCEEKGAGWAFGADCCQAWGCWGQQSCG